MKFKQAFIIGGKGEENCNVSSIDAINYITEIWNTRFKSKKEDTNNV